MVCIFYTLKAVNKWLGTIRDLKITTLEHDFVHSKTSAF